MEVEGKQQKHSIDPSGHISSVKNHFMPITKELTIFFLSISRTTPCTQCILKLSLQSFSGGINEVVAIHTRPLKNSIESFNSKNTFTYMFNLSKHHMDQ